MEQRRATSLAWLGAVGGHRGVFPEGGLAGEGILHQHQEARADKEDAG